jgi:hypothetical protein
MPNTTIARMFSIRRLRCRRQAYQTQRRRTSRGAALEYIDVAELKTIQKKTVFFNTTFTFHPIFFMENSVLVSSLEVRKSPHGDHQVMVLGLADCTRIQIDWIGTAARVLREVDSLYFSQVTACPQVCENLSLTEVLAFVAEEEQASKPKGYNCVRFVSNVIAKCCLPNDQENFM